MDFTKQELEIWHDNLNENDNFCINPKSNRKIKKNGSTYKKLEKNYIKLINKNNINFIENNINIKNKTYIENKIIDFLKKEFYLRDTLKPPIYNFKILENDKCNCEQKISIKINEKKYIKKDIENILEIINDEYNNKNIQNIIGLEYECKIEQIDTDGNVYGFVFSSFDNNYEFPIILAHCYSKKNKNEIQICLHIQYLSFLNCYNNKSFDYETHILIEY